MASKTQPGEFVSRNRLHGSSNFILPDISINQPDFGNDNIVQQSTQQSSSAPLAGVDIGEINPIRYRGYYYDAETNYYFCQTRYYSPQWRRFINADSLFIAGDALIAANMYAYCDGNPVMRVDPNGMKSYRLRTIYFSPEAIKGIRMFANIAGLSLNERAMYNTLVVYGTGLEAERLGLNMVGNVSISNRQYIFFYGVLMGTASFVANGETWSYEFIVGREVQLRAYAAYIESQRYDLWENFLEFDTEKVLDEDAPSSIWLGIIAAIPGAARGVIWGYRALRDLATVINLAIGSEVFAVDNSYHLIPLSWLSNK